MHVSHFAFLWQQHLTFVLFSQSVRPEECLLLISHLLRGLSLGADAPLFPPRLFHLIDALRLKSAGRGIASRASFHDARLRPVLLNVRLVQSDLACTARRTAEMQVENRLSLTTCFQKRHWQTFLCACPRKDARKSTTSVHGLAVVYFSGAAENWLVLKHK